ncbi:MAG: hypothetical protein LBU65_15630 [Planctomycetaceae bacterium]|nr:hypothetical protein [Planctomycetaceae bacterium]
MTPRILVRPISKRRLKNLPPLRSFGAVVVSFLLGAGIMYCVMIPKEPIMKPKTEYTESHIRQRFVLDDESLQKIKSPIDVIKLTTIRYELVGKPVEPDCTYRAMMLRIEN